MRFLFIALALALALAACSAPQTAAPIATGSPTGLLADGSSVTLALEGDRIVDVRAAPATTTWLWPPIVDSHVHLAFWPVADKLALHGVEAAVDLAAPEATIAQPSPIHVLVASARRWSERARDGAASPRGPR